MNFIIACLTLIATGDYVPAMFPWLGHEDSPVVAALLTLAGVR